MSKYQFTHDWFSHNIPVWEQLIQYLPGKPGERYFLEIGSFEGRSMVWIAENMMGEGDCLDCVDTWKGGEEHSAEDMALVESRFDYNLEQTGMSNIEKLKETSVEALASHLWGGERGWKMDFIYIDGSHIAKDVLTDACMAWQLLKPQGLMVFDDYRWGAPRDILHRPKLAIDAFCNIFAEEAEIIHVGYQLVVRKKEQGK